MRAFRPSRRVFLAAASAASLAAVSAARASRRSERFLAHEWGTITTLQDEDGKELHGINIDDEPVPDFVHNLNPFLLSKPLLSSRHWQYRQQAAEMIGVGVRQHDDVQVIATTGAERRHDDALAGIGASHHTSRVDQDRRTVGQIDQR